MIGEMDYLATILDSLVVFWDAIPGWWRGFLDTMHTASLVVGAIIVFIIHAKLSGGGGVRTVDQYISKD